MRQCHAVDVRVVEGEEGKPSESFVSLGGGRIGFATPNRLHYLATRNRRRCCWRTHHVPAGHGCKGTAGVAGEVSYESQGGEPCLTS